MNSDWITVILIFLGLVFVPRFIAEVAWYRRLRAKERASGSLPQSMTDRLRAQVVPSVVFAAVGLACAGAAFVIVLSSR